MNRGAGGEKRGVEQQRVLWHLLAFMQQCAVFAVLDPATDDGDAEGIARRVRRFGLIGTIFPHFGRSAAIEAESEVDVAETRTVVPMAESCEPDRAGLANFELDESVARRELLLRRRARIVAAVAAAGFLQDGAVHGRVDEVRPRNSGTGGVKTDVRQERNDEDADSRE